MVKTGITGGIGAGKSLVASIVEALGHPVYYADNEAKRLMSDSPQLKDELITLFGQNTFINNTLNRPFIAKAIFENNTLLKKTNALVHPVVKADFALWTERNQTSPLVFLESALIFEAQLQTELDAVICVTAPLSVRIKRVMQRDRCAEQDVLKRITAQKTEEEMALKADFAVCNDNQMAITPQLEAVLAQLKHC